MTFNQLPPSNNEYLKPAVNNTVARPYAYMYESQKSKDFKKIFREALMREIKKQGWDKEETAEGHWYLECKFVQSSKAQDCNNYFKILLDSLTGYIIKDDKNILPRVHKVTYSKENPSFTFVLRKANYIGLFKDEGAKNDFIEANCASCRFNRNGSCSLLKKIIDGREIAEYNPIANKCTKRIERKGF